MIIVDVEVPMMGKRYDFQIDESVPLWNLRDEIAEMVCRKEQYEFKGDEKKLFLWDAEKGRMLHMGNTAWENGLRTGSRILLL